MELQLDLAQTIYVSKGLMFGDAVHYNRFKNSQVSKGLDEKTAVSGIDEQFAAIKVDNRWCGICGVSFKLKLEKLLKLEKSVLIKDDKSVLNDTRPPASLDSSWAKPVSTRALSLDQPKQSGPFQWGKPQPKAFEDPDFIETRLITVRQNHIKEEGHLQKCFALNSFRKKYRETFVPQLNNFKSFLKNPDYNLEDKDFREKNYNRHSHEIDRMFDKCARIEREIQKLIIDRKWSEWGQINQNIKEVQTDLNIVGPYVLEVHIQLKKGEEEKLVQVSASASGVSVQSENWDEDDVDIEPVVEELQMPTRHQKRRNKNQKKRR